MPRPGGQGYWRLPRQTIVPSALHRAASAYVAEHGLYLGTKERRLRKPSMILRMMLRVCENQNRYGGSEYAKTMTAIFRRVANGMNTLSVPQMHLIRQAFRACVLKSPEPSPVRVQPGGNRRPRRKLLPPLPSEMPDA